MRLVVVAIAVAAIAAAASSRAYAQENPQAEQLFRVGRDLVKQGKYAEGCSKLEASQRIERNVTTLLNLASCREKNGQLATAWALFVRAAADARKAGNQPLVDIANGFVTKLEPRLPYVTVSVPDTSRVEGLVLELDGRALDPAEYNQGIPVDPGKHEVLGRAPGHEPWTTTVEIREAERRSVEVPRFKEIATLAPARVEPSPVQQQDEGDVPPSGGMPGLRKAAIGAGAVGAVGLIAMTAFGLQARSEWNDAKDRNDDQLRQDADSKATLATIGGVVGIAGVAAGITLWIVGKPTSHERPTAWRPIASRDALGLAFGGRF